jgi:hypothetical protein
MDENIARKGAPDRLLKQLTRCEKGGQRKFFLVWYARCREIKRIADKWLTESPWERTDGLWTEYTEILPLSFARD